MRQTVRQVVVPHQRDVDLPFSGSAREAVILEEAPTLVNRAGFPNRKTRSEGHHGQEPNLAERFPMVPPQPGQVGADLQSAVRVEVGRHS